jgi:hypothetical protein
MKHEYHSHWRASQAEQGVIRYANCIVYGGYYAPEDLGVMQLPRSK